MLKQIINSQFQKKNYHTISHQLKIQPQRTLLTSALFKPTVTFHSITHSSFIDASHVIITSNSIIIQRMRKLYRSIPFTKPPQFSYSLLSNQIITHSTLPIIDCNYLTSQYRYSRIDVKTVLDHATHSIHLKTPLLSSVQAFRFEIYNSPTLKINFEEALRHVPKGETLYKCTPDLVFQMLSYFCRTLPKHYKDSMVEIPFFNFFLCLLDTRFGQTFFSDPIVNQSFQLIFRDYYIFLNSKMSLENVNQGFLSKQSYDFAQLATQPPSQTMHKQDNQSFRSWIDWYSRQIQISERPVDSRQNTITHSAEAYPFNFKALTGQKRWHNLQNTMYSLFQLFQSSQQEVSLILDNHFLGGVCYQSYFDPSNYHRWHSPVSGTIAHTYRFNPNYCFDQSMSNGPFGSKPRDVMIKRACTRHIVIIQMDGQPKRYVGVVAIGNSVSSCVTKVIRGERVEKGEELGFFEFGAYSLVLVLDKRLEAGFNPQIFQNSEQIMVKRRQKINSWLATYR